MCVTIIVLGFLWFMHIVLPRMKACRPDAKLMAISPSVQLSTVYMLNFWYRYVKFVADSLHRDCQVCTHMPVAANNSHIVPLPVTDITEWFPDILVLTSTLLFFVTFFTGNRDTSLRTRKG